MKLEPWQKVHQGDISERGASARNATGVVAFGTPRMTLVPHRVPEKLQKKKIEFFWYHDIHFFGNWYHQLHSTDLIE